MKIREDDILPSDWKNHISPLLSHYGSKNMLIEENNQSIRPEVVRVDHEDTSKIN
jgi:hypothetical protein